jgi:putative transposase
VGSLSGYERTCGVVRGIGWRIVWFPKSRKRVVGGRVAARLAELVSPRAAERGWSVEALEIVPDRVDLFVPTAPALVAYQGKGFTSPVFRCEFRYLHASLPTRWPKSYFVARVGRVSEGTIGEDIDERTVRGKR